MAKGCKKVGSQDLDDTEFLNVLKVDADQIDEWIKKEEFQQMAHVTAWMLAKEQG
jgi:ADP-ribose pyrophosphatase